jgi:transcriptional regulator with XRE-family HTH domain
MKARKSLDTKIKQVEDELKRTTLFLDMLTIIRDSGFSMESLAQEAGVAPATVYFWLSGCTKHPRIDTLYKIADALGYDIVLRQMRTVKPTASQRKLRPV